MPEHFADRLIDAMERTEARVCVGLDPVFERLPSELTARGAGPVARLGAIAEFGRRVLHIAATLVPAVKINIAYFEIYQGPGLDVYLDLVHTARGLGLVVIGDCKRGDVGHSAELYAQAQLAEPQDGAARLAPDAVTASAFLGSDGLDPFLKIAAQQGKGLFALVRTSNPSAGEVQDFQCENGLTFSEHLGHLVHRWGTAESLIGRRGYSALGAVVAPPSADAARRLRAIMPRSVFLVPGYGAQGLTARDVASCFNADGGGAIINASRSVIYAYRDDASTESWERSIERACRDFIADVNQGAGV